MKYTVTPISNSPGGAAHAAALKYKNTRISAGSEQLGMPKQSKQRQASDSLFDDPEVKAALSGPFFKQNQPQQQRAPSNYKPAQMYADPKADQAALDKLHKEINSVGKEGRSQGQRAESRPSQGPPPGNPGVQQPPKADESPGDPFPGEDVARLQSEGRGPSEGRAVTSEELMKGRDTYDAGSPAAAQAMASAIANERATQAEIGNQASMSIGIRAPSSIR